jgi:DNA-directed RNA polymerase alpha subunit
VKGTYISVECPHCGKEAARLRFIESVAEGLNAKPHETGEPAAESEQPPDKVLSQAVGEVVSAWPFRSPELQKKLQTRTLNILRYANISTIGELMSKSERDMLRQKNCGSMIVGELRAMLQSMNLSFRNDHGDMDG